MQAILLRCLPLVVLLAAAGAPAQQVLKGRVQLNMNGHPLPNAAQAVVWLTPIGVDCGSSTPGSVQNSATGAEEQKLSAFPSRDSSGRQSRIPQP